MSTALKVERTIVDRSSSTNNGLVQLQEGVCACVCVCVCVGGTVNNLNCGSMEFSSGINEAKYTPYTKCSARQAGAMNCKEHILCVGSTVWPLLVSPRFRLTSIRLHHNNVCTVHLFRLEFTLNAESPFHSLPYSQALALATARK
jgi:hypothetical protein